MINQLNQWLMSVAQCFFFIGSFHGSGDNHPILPIPICARWMATMRQGLQMIKTWFNTTGHLLFNQIRSQMLNQSTSRIDWFITGFWMEHIHHTKLWGQPLCQWGCLKIGGKLTETWFIMISVLIWTFHSKKSIGEIWTALPPGALQGRTKPKMKRASSLEESIGFQDCSFMHLYVLCLGSKADAIQWLAGKCLYMEVSIWDDHL